MLRSGSWLEVEALPSEKAKPAKARALIQEPVILRALCKHKIIHPHRMQHPPMLGSFHEYRAPALKPICSLSPKP